MKTITFIKISALAALLNLALTACKNPKHMDNSKTLTETDRHYSALSAKEGMNTAFLAMFDEAGVKLQADHPPVEGYENIRTLLLSENDTAFILTWEPMFAKTAASGDMGYTYGTYQVKDKASDTITVEGTYVTIWMKTTDGQWKAVLDAGNPGLGNPK